VAVQVGILNLDCRSCSETQKAERGCIEDSPIPGKWKFDGFELRRCPNSVVSRQSLEYLEAYELYEKGVLPYGGGWLKHSKKFMDAMKIVQREVLKLRQKDAGK